ncbi:glycosyltransferase [Cryomorphaceae bacterium 1068]|nr:glycosyltransferase [Cryomorphaceae bacterium 1068]
MKSDNRTILIFSDWYLPGYKAGGPITSCANIVELLGDEFDFKVVCSDRDYLENESYSGVKLNEWVQVGKAQVMYLSPDKQDLSNIKKIIREVKAQMAFLNGMFSKAFTIFPLIALRNQSTKVVIAPRGMLAPAAMGIKSFKKKTFLRLSKLFGLFSGVKFHATNSVESEQISTWFGKVPIEIVANIPGNQSLDSPGSSHTKEKNRLSLYTVARIAPEKNIHFALECLKHVDSEISVSFQMIGSVYDQSYLNRCKKIIETLPDNVEVRFLGAMPGKDIPGVAAKADFFFLPTAGENYGHAIVEALLTGVPVVISDQTPWRELVENQMGYDLTLVREEFTVLLNKLGKMADEEYKLQYKNIEVNAAALINLDKLHMAYQNLFHDRNRS